MRRRFISKTNKKSYLTIYALEDGLTVSLSTNACEYCIDGDGNWKSLAAGVTTESINAGQTLSFRGNLTPTRSAGIGTFTISRKCNLEGNCMSMLFGDNAANKRSLRGKSYAFYDLFYNCANIVNVSENFLPAATLADSCYLYMFYGCTGLTTAPKLPAMTLAVYCYGYMFYGCRSLTTAPELPATTLADGCYNSMFSGCSSLTTAPELPVTTLANSCYNSMFQGCSSLTTAPELPATALANNCYQYMFYSCSSLTTAPALPATTLVDICYANMFQNCTSLTTAPALPATALVHGCYIGMFYNCNKLNYIEMLATDISAYRCLSGWVTGVSSTGTFVKNSAMTSLSTGVNGIPEGWTVVNDGGDVVQKTVNHGVITSSGWGYLLTFEFPIACKYMTVDCLPHFWYLTKGSTQTTSDAPGGLGDSIKIYASNNGYDDYRATNEDDTYIYEVTINV